MKKPEKREAHAPRNHPKSYGKWLKRTWVKSMRRAARRDPEGAPRKLMACGWQS